jgi:hypothetical protein
MLLLPQQLRQLGEIDGQPPGLIVKDVLLFLFDAATLA